MANMIMHLRSPGGKIIQGQNLSITRGTGAMYSQSVHNFATMEIVCQVATEQYGVCRQIDLDGRKVERSL
jgi:hypothetical protein